VTQFDQAEAYRAPKGHLAASAFPVATSMSRACQSEFVVIALRKIEALPQLLI
jgi:hypothetical protein